MNFDCHYHSSEDFRPKRLLYFSGSKSPDASNPFLDSTPNFTLPEPMPPGGETRTDLQGVQADVEAKFETEYNQKTDKVDDFIKNHESYDSSDWRTWNDEFVSTMGAVDGMTTTTQIKALQQVVFRKLGVIDESGNPIDPSAVIDGQLGPYTLACLAQVAGSKRPPSSAILERNPKLADMIAKDAEAESAAIQQAGETILTKAVKQDDGTFLIEKGEYKTYFKFENGRWLWASDTQKKAVPPQWQEAGQDLHKAEPGTALAEVNAISESLARITDLSVTGTPLLRNATRENGNLVVKTGERKTYFRINNGKWEWASETQFAEKPPKWVPVGKGRYTKDGKDDPEMAVINTIADRLNQREIVVETSAKEAEAEKMRAAIEEARTKDPKLDIAKAYVVKVGDNYQVRIWESEKEIDRSKGTPAKDVPPAPLPEQTESPYQNPHGKPDPGGPFQDAQLRDYYSSEPGKEPIGGPQLPDGWLESHPTSAPAPVGIPRDQVVAKLGNDSVTTEVMSTIAPNEMITKDRLKVAANNALVANRINSTQHTAVLQKIETV